MTTDPRVEARRQVEAAVKATMPTAAARSAQGRSSMPITLDDYVLVNAAMESLAAADAVRPDTAYLRGLRVAREVVERQTDLTELVHFDRPSDFRKGVLTCLSALDARIAEASGPAGDGV